MEFEKFYGVYNAATTNEFLGSGCLFVGEVAVPVERHRSFRWFLFPVEQYDRQVWPA